MHTQPCLVPSSRSYRSSRCYVRDYISLRYVCLANSICIAYFYLYKTVSYIAGMYIAEPSRESTGRAVPQGFWSINRVYILLQGPVHDFEHMHAYLQKQAERSTMLTCNCGTGSAGQLTLTLCSAAGLFESHQDSDRAVCQVSCRTMTFACNAIPHVIHNHCLQRSHETGHAQVLPAIS